MKGIWPAVRIVGPTCLALNAGRFLVRTMSQSIWFWSPWVQDIQDFLDTIHFDPFLAYFHTVCGALMVFLLIMSLVPKGRRLTGGAPKPSDAAAILAVFLSFYFLWGAAMGNSKENLAYLCALAWFVTSLLWVANILLGFLGGSRANRIESEPPAR